ncbi:MAG: N-acetylneuraminate synthase family protein [Myxococcales bacterium]|nr:N-acetylneuraminate synthase family protein [Myxococcales bacterium]
MVLSFRIAGREVGAGAAPFIIAEVAQAHDGSLGTAHAYIDAIAGAGADAVKFQTHIAAAESTPSEPWRIQFSLQDESRYAYWQRMEFSFSQWQGLKEHAVSCGLIFLSSPFSEEAVSLLERVDVPAWKIGSGEVMNLPLIQRVQRTGRPVLISSGMSSWEELDAVANCMRVPFAFMQCTSKYPCPPEEIGLHLISEMRQRYQVPAGLSDHSATPYAGLAAAALGVDLVEVHVVLDRRCFGPDTSSSLTISELSKLVEGTRFIHRSLQQRIDKDEVAEELVPMKRLFQKSVMLREDAPARYVLKAEDLILRKPGTGIPASDLEKVVGRKLRNAVAKNIPLQEDDLDDVG